MNVKDHRAVQADPPVITPLYRPAAMLAAAGAAILAIFYSFPQLDIAASRLFFEPCPDQPLRCGRFPHVGDPEVMTIREIVQATPVIFMILLAAIIVWRIYRKAEPLRTWALGACILGWVVGAGLIVNGILKPHSGRPRPIYTELFGGDLPFAPAGKFTGICDSNCSFVSGEASSAAILICLATLAPQRWRIPFIIAAVAFFAFTSLFRMVLGAHFLSDTLLAGIVTGLSYCLMTIVCFRLAHHGKMASS